jgi:NADPH-dependent 2,4-dienoyl-CoA reductase/sulfur reductase-like enzyme
MKYADVVVVGGGPAGLAAAVRLYDMGIRDILILEREHSLGGILRQCIHDGFGLTRFGVSLSGPEYASRFIKEVEKRQIPCITDTTVIEITKDKLVTAAGEEGLLQVQAKAVILTMGCRERTRGALAIPGTRPAGVMTAGVAQAYINLQNRMIGKEVVILGSGDIGMIMARRLTLEGAHVIAVFEVMPVASGLPRNIEQCLNDYGIPLYLSHTVTDIKGTDRLESVTISQVDDRMQPIPGTEKEYACDTLILSVGLIPENELTLGAGASLDGNTKGALVDEFYQSDIPGIFAAGNVLHVHDLVDFVSMEAEALAEGAAAYVREGSLPACPVSVTAGENVGHALPQKVSGKRDFLLSLRPRRPLQNVKLRVSQGDQTILERKMKKVLPAEMIQLKIRKEKISGEGSITVSIS